jgi:glycosyltransferase involved in cell wall biosynthesis
LKITQFVQSTNPLTGGVAKAVNDLSQAFLKVNTSAVTLDNADIAIGENDVTIVHGLWQWPGIVAYKNWQRKKNYYVVFPHGMLDPWFKKAYLLKHLKKQVYWWWRQGKILENAHAVCFTTEEERRLAQKTFWPYKCQRGCYRTWSRRPTGRCKKSGI